MFAEAILGAFRTVNLEQIDVPEGGGKTSVYRSPFCQAAPVG